MDFEEFNQSCLDASVEVSVSTLPNPGNYQAALRVLTFNNYGDQVVSIICTDKTYFVPAKGTQQVVLRYDEELPKLERT